MGRSLIYNDQTTHKRFLGVPVSSAQLCLKSPKSFLDTVSTGSGSDVLND
jgi:hypothetical protein